MRTGSFHGGQTIYQCILYRNSQKCHSIHPDAGKRQLAQTVILQKHSDKHFRKCLHRNLQQSDIHAAEQKYTNQSVQNFFIMSGSIMITKDCTASGRNPLRRAEYNGHKALYDGCTGNQLIS